MDIAAAFTQKYGPLTAWQWGLGVGGLAFLFMKFGRKDTAVPSDSTEQGASLQRDPATGEFQSSQTQSKTDPDTGEMLTSSYSATGPLTGGWGGGVGLPMAYQMPYSGGDVYVNLPGDQQNMQPGRPAHYPPVKGPGVAPGKMGGFWWTPLNRADVYNMAGRPYGEDMAKLTPDAQAAARIAMNYTRIVDANPQFNWAGIQDINSLIGQPIYIPQGDTGDPNKTGFMPPNASLNAPSGYTPVGQQTSVSGTA